MSKKKKKVSKKSKTTKKNTKHSTPSKKRRTAAPDHTTPHEGVRHVLGANEPKDGKPIDPVDEVLRLRALQLEVGAIAKQLGLDNELKSTYTPTEPQTERANDIKDLAQQPMQQAADEAIATRTRITVKKGNGDQIEMVKTEIGLRGLLRESVGSLAALTKQAGESVVNTIKGAVKVVLGIRVKVGKWSVVADAKGDAKQEVTKK